MITYFHKETTHFCNLMDKDPIYNWEDRNLDLDKANVRYLIYDLHDNCMFLVEEKEFKESFEFCNDQFFEDIKKHNLDFTDKQIQELRDEINRE